jgi:hypothetical protein
MFVLIGATMHHIPTHLLNIKKNDTGLSSTGGVAT